MQRSCYSICGRVWPWPACDPAPQLKKEGGWERKNGRLGRNCTIHSYILASMTISAVPTSTRVPPSLPYLGQKYAPSSPGMESMRPTADQPATVSTDRR